MKKLTDQLSELATVAPPALAERVMRATGAGRFYDVVAGPTGDLLVGWSSNGIYGISPDFAAETFLGDFTREGIPPLRAEMPRRLRAQVVKAITTGKLGAVSVDIGELTEFQQAVLRKTAEIPVGELRPYGWVAREIGSPGATRAVGSALNKNPIPVLIPCHRVGNSDGSVGRYAYGPGMKRALLRSEGLDTDAIDAAADRGIRFVGSATTNVYCHPTCHHAARIKPENRIELRDAREAAGAGMRACKVCRPAVAA